MKYCRKGNSEKAESRRKEMIELLCDGLTTKEISQKVNLSHRTLEAVFKELMDINDCNNRVHLVAKYLFNKYGVTRIVG